MRSEIMHQIVETIEAEVRSRPSPFEFEMAYQARVAMDRIKFAIKHAEQFSKPCIHMRDASLQLLDALERLESLDRRFQIRSQGARERNGSVAGRQKGEPGMLWSGAFYKTFWPAEEAAWRQASRSAS